jgi:polysaccharide export outer membrane protein
MKIRKIFLFYFIFLLSFTNLSFSQTNLEEKAMEYYRLGQIYYEHGLYQEAEKQFRKALKILGKIKEVPKEEKVKVVLSEKKRKEYIIGPGDVLHISVWENPDLEQDVIVRPDGKISFPLIDEVQAEGLTIPELDKLMTEKLKEYIRYPDVSISLKKIGGERIIVLGEVKSPGVYTLAGRKTVLEAIALAGGFTKDAVLNSVIVIKRGFISPEAKRINLAINLAKALKRGKIKEDIFLESQDIVYVPKKFIADLNYFLNQILDPLTKGMYTSKEIRYW